MVKVAVLGAAGGIGQPLSLLLKRNPKITQLALYDIVNTPGVAADLSHINTRSTVTGHLGQDQLVAAVSGANIVVIPAGVPRKPGMTRDDLFKINAGIVRGLAVACAQHAAAGVMVLVISNPVNSMVPIVAEVFKQHGKYDPRRIFGITSLDVVRASTFVSQLKRWVDPATSYVPVVGGHSGATIVPLLSQLSPPEQFTQAETEALTHRIQFGGDEVVQAKDGAGSATLSMAFAGERFVNAVIDAVTGTSPTTVIIEPTFIATEAVVAAFTGGLPFFALPVRLGPEGVAGLGPLKPVTAYEQRLLDTAIAELSGNINKGIAYAQESNL
ncbi:malate dehydrogenase [Ramicandelaber brevisporus]|nr:malate dehydrogenase [Ramicandelaber brevisporus]